MEISVILNHKGAVVHAISPEATVFEAIQQMAERNVGALVVMSGEALEGLVSERDYTRKVALRGRMSKETPVRLIMAAPPITVTPRHTIEDCMRLMTEKRVRHLPVVDDSRVIGLVSIGDLVNWIISSQTSMIRQMEDYIVGNYPG